MAAVAPDRFAEAGKDDVLVLGRNVYQAACGGSNSAVAMLTDLSGSLLPFPEALRFHLLNGMLYEVYFDSRGRKRKRGKTDKLDEVFALEDDASAAGSFAFIRNALLPYTDELFYVPGSKIEVCVDVVIGKNEFGPAVAQVCFEGQNVFYNETGDGYFDPTLAFFPNSETRATFRTNLAAALATPTFRLKVSYVGLPLVEDKFQASRAPNLQRIAPK